MPEPSSRQRASTKGESKKQKPAQCSRQFDKSIPQSQRLLSPSQKRKAKVFRRASCADYFFFASSRMYPTNPLIWSSVILPLYAGIFLPLPFAMLSVNCASVCFCTSPDVRSVTPNDFPVGTFPVPSGPWQAAHFDL